MSIEGHIYIFGNSSGAEGGDTAFGTIDDSYTPTYRPTQQILSLSSGNNTITIPTGMKAVVLTPPAGNTETITLKGDASDVGIALALERSQKLDFDDAVTTFVLNSTGNVKLQASWD